MAGVLPLFDAVGQALGVAMVRHASTQKVNLLASEARSAIMRLVAQRPGILMTDLRRMLGCSAGTIQHHLALLERHNLLASERDGKRRRLFVGSLPLLDRQLMSIVQSGRTEELVRSILARPGIVQRELTEGLAISRKVLRGYVDRLTESGLVDEVNIGRSRTYFPSPRLRELVGPPSDDIDLGVNLSERPATSGAELAMPLLVGLTAKQDAAPTDGAQRDKEGEGSPEGP